MIRVAGIVKESIVDGPGIRFVVFVQGCRHNCKGCHNHETHSYEGGTLITQEEILEQIKENPLLDGVTFSGGEPFDQAKELAELGEKIKDMGLHLITYTGYIYEKIVISENENWLRLFHITDVLVDGPFKITERTLEKRFRGSLNQRIIDVKKNQVIDWG